MPLAYCQCAIKGGKRLRREEQAIYRRAEETLGKTISGGACVNDTLVHFAQERLPFGGVGNSGMGAYHGEVGFQTFSHARSVLVSSSMSAALR